MGLDEIHPRILREQDDIVAESFSIIFQKLWHSSKVPSDRRRQTIAPTLKKAKKGYPENKGPVSLISPTGNTKEQIPPEICQNIWKIGR